jgi:diguanylate cyclase (GGDEF)-like protein
MRVVGLQIPQLGSDTGRTHMGEPASAQHERDPGAVPREDRVLFVDDDADLLRSLERSVRRACPDWDVELTTAPLEALRAVSRDPGRVIVTDWSMPELDGLSLCELVRSVQADDRPRPYLIMLTGRTQPESASVALERGADDFVSKPVSNRELIARIGVGLRLLKAERELRAANARLAVLAQTDPLTGVASRRHGLESLERELARVERGLQALCVALLDIDHFKQINDTCGHAAGDRVLEEVARRLRENCRPYDTIARWGGEEFLLVCPRRDSATDETLVPRLLRALAQEPVDVGPDVQVALTASAGFARVPIGERCDPAALLARADRALYAAKQAGRNRAAADAEG